MKKIIICMALAFFGVSGAIAQENVVKVNPLGVLFGAAELGYERALNDKSSVEVSLAYSRSDASLGNDTATASGFGAEGKYKLYFSSSKDAPRGWYGAPVATYVSSTAKSGDSKGTVSFFGVGAVGGYQWIFGGGDSGFALDLNLGAQYVSASTGGDITSVDIDGVIPRIGLAIGYAW